MVESRNCVIIINPRKCVVFGAIIRRDPYCDGSFPIARDPYCDRSRRHPSISLVVMVEWRGSWPSQLTSEEASGFRFDALPDLIPTDEMYADMLTKALDDKTFHKHRRTVMNHQ